MSGIFISYRREDSAETAHRLHRALTTRFGADSVFIDVENIAPGDNFAEVIDEKVGFCDALIAVVGRKWLNSRHADGQRRLDDPRDSCASKSRRPSAAISRSFQCWLTAPRCPPSASFPLPYRRW